MPFIEEHYVWSTRIPVKVPSFDHIVRPFSLLLWFLFLATLLCFCVLFYIMYSIYKLLALPEHVTERDIPWYDFVLLPIAGIFEPNYMSWFPARTGQTISNLCYFIQF